MKQTRLPQLPAWTPGLIDDMTIGRPVRPCAPLPRHTVTPVKRRPHIDPADLFTRAELFRIAYVPFVIGELVWDYAQTCIDLAAQQGIHATKPLARAIHKLRLDYDRARYSVISEGNRAHETYNAEAFEAHVSDITEKFVATLQCEINSLYPDLTSDARWMVVCAYQAIVLGKALQAFHDKQLAHVERRIKEEYGIDVPISQMLPSQFGKMLSLLPLFYGDKRVSPRFPLKDYIATYANQIALIELNESAEIIS